jgi:hypothetical protein
MHSPVKASENESPKRNHLMKIVGLIEGNETRHPCALQKGKTQSFRFMNYLLPEGTNLKPGDYCTHHGN